MRHLSAGTSPHLPEVVLVIEEVGGYHIRSGVSRRHFTREGDGKT